MLLPLLLLVANITLPPPTSTNIVDGAGLLNDDERADVYDQMTQIKKRAGVTVGLLTIDQLDDDPKAVAVRALNFWQMGPDSVILLISKQPRKIFLQPGSNLAVKFDLRTSTDITNSMVPNMKRGRFKDAIETALMGISNVMTTATVAPVAPVHLNPAGEPLPESGDSHSGLIFFLVFIGVAGGIVLLAYLIERSKKRRYEALDLSSGYTPTGRSAADEIAAMVRRYSPPPVQVTNIVTPAPSDNLATGILIGESLERNRQPAPTYTPPPVAPVRHVPAPHYSPPPARSSPPSNESSDSSWGSGGGGSSWDSGGGFDSGSSGGDGGGGSSW